MGVSVPENSSGARGVPVLPCPRPCPCPCPVSGVPGGRRAGIAFFSPSCGGRPSRCQARRLWRCLSADSENRHSRDARHADRALADRGSGEWRDVSPRTPRIATVGMPGTQIARSRTADLGRGARSLRGLRESSQSGCQAPVSRAGGTRCVSGGAAAREGWGDRGRAPVRVDRP